MADRRPSAGDGADRAGAGPPGDALDGDDEPVDVEALLADLRALASDVDSQAARDELRETKELLRVAGARGIIDSGVRRLDRRDAAEALVGSVVFASPLLVEDGIFDIATHLFATTVAGLPVFLLANVAFVVLMTYALVEWTGRDRTEARRILGALPARVLMILAVSFVTAAALMTVWGRVGDWQPPSEALARITVLWTVGSLGAALGDILADDADPAAPPSGQPGTEPVAGAPADGPAGRADPGEIERLPGSDLDRGELVAELDSQFEELYESLDSEADRRAVRRIEARADQGAAEDLFGDEIQKYTSRDVAEAFVGSVFFAIPLLVEDGVFDVAEYFLSFTVGRFPVFFLANAAFVVLMIAAILYWTGPQDVQVTRPLFGFLPRRLLGIAVVSFLTAAMLMTLWGRVDGWADPVVAVARISAVWTVASFGAALGDILPGESSGADINDQLSELGDALADSVEDRD